MKRKLLSLAVIVMCLSLLAHGTLTYFTAEDTAHNVITSGKIAIELQEWADEDRTVPFPADGIHGVMPGTEITKIVEVENTGNNAAYIRIAVNKQLVLREGAEEEPNLDLMKLHFASDHWTPGEDGYYYYDHALEAGHVTEPLIASVSFDPTMGNLYQNCTARVDVVAYAVQTANNTVPVGGEVADVSGWPEVTPQ